MIVTRMIRAQDSTKSLPPSSHSMGRLRSGVGEEGVPERAMAPR